ncbi:MAG: hypothetical protein KGH72_05830 [Candidatus Micrarchaeota archaeon]|nr:hypothetical protein [Candidatus Micrarchaeota archaeon]
MVFSSFELPFYVQLLVYFLLAALALLRIMRYNSNEMRILVAFFIAGMVIFWVEGVGPNNIVILAVGLLIFNGLLGSHSDGIDSMFHVALSIAYMVLTYEIGVAFIAQAMLLGMLGSITSLKEPRFRISTKTIELKRDVLHIVAGALLMLCFIFLQNAEAITILLLVILIGLFGIRYAETNKRGALYRYAYTFERSGARLGHGALWLGLGSLIAIAFLNNTYVLLVFSATFIADPLATIVGIALGGPKLPYNKSKSVVGSAVYFVVAAIIGSIFVGVWALPLALAAAMIEGARLGMDDNFTVSLGLTLILFAAQVA